MNIERAIEVARLIYLLDGVRGRKKLQKIVHLLGSRGAKPFSHEFTLHFFGPFSRELADELDFLSEAQIVDETSTDSAFTYNTANPRLESFLRRRSPNWGGFARRLAAERTPFLEALSTYVFLVYSGVPARQVSAAFTKIKPHLKAHLPRCRVFAKEERLLRDA